MFALSKRNCYAFIVVATKVVFPSVMYVSVKCATCFLFLFQQIYFLCFQRMIELN